MPILPIITSRPNSGLLQDGNSPNHGNGKFSFTSGDIGSPGNNNNQEGKNSISALHDVLQHLESRLQSKVQDQANQNDSTLTVMQKIGDHLAEPGSSRQSSVAVAQTPTTSQLNRPSSSSSWVVALLQYAQFHPPNSTDESNAASNSAEANASGKKAMLPSLRPNRRDHVLLLAQWLQDMLARVEKRPSSPDHLGPDSMTTTAEIAEAALYVCNVAVEELRKQISLECRERGELLSVLVERMVSLASARASSLGEERLRAAQESTMSVLANAAALNQDVALLERSIEEAASDHDKELTQSKQISSVLQSRLVNVGVTASEMQRKWKVADMALKTETERRLEVDAQLINTKELLSRTEHDWLYFRAKNEQLEQKIRELEQQLKGSQYEVGLARNSAAEAQKRLEEVLGLNARGEVALERTRHEYETSEILVVSMRQQIRELEHQLAQMKEYQREQTVKLGKFIVDMETLEKKNDDLTTRLKNTTQAKEETESKLQETTTTLNQKSKLLDDAQARVSVLEEDLSKETKRLMREMAEVEDTLSKVRIDLVDTVLKLNDESNKRIDFDKEISIVRELINILGRQVEAQGADGVPRRGDAAWTVMGPVGAVQRVLGIATRHNQMLWDRDQGAHQEILASQERAKAEAELMEQLRNDLHDSRLQVGKFMREKEAMAGKLVTCEGERRDMDHTITHLKEDLVQCQERAVTLAEELSIATEKVNHLSPLVPQLATASHERDEYKMKLEILQFQGGERVEALKMLERDLDFYKTELGKVSESNKKLLMEIKMLMVKVQEGDDAKRQVINLSIELEALKSKVVQVVDAHADTARQLELAKFFLQGLDKPGTPGSPLTHIHAAGSLSSPKSNRGGFGEEFSSDGRPRSPYVIQGSRSGTPNWSMAGGDRPTSASSILRAETPGEVADILANRMFSQESNATQKTNWNRIKIMVLSWFANRLRRRVATEMERVAALEVEVLRTHAYYLHEMRMREEYLLRELEQTGLQAFVGKTLVDAIDYISGVRGEIKTVKLDMASLAGVTTVTARKLDEIKVQKALLQEVSCQTGENLSNPWVVLLHSLPADPASEPMSLAAVCEALVRIYVRQVGTVIASPTWGAERHDSVYDAIMEHYNSLRGPGTYGADLMDAVGGPISRLLRSVRAFMGETKVRVFANFVGVSPDGIVWPQRAWHFTLHLLFCMRTLLGGSWRSTVKAWASTEGVQVPVHAAFDLVGNLFNVQTPADLESTVGKRVGMLVLPGSTGPCVDFDALMMLLVSEYMAASCPRNPLLFPRRLTDGTLFNIFNFLGMLPNDVTPSGNVRGNSPPSRSTVSQGTPLLASNTSISQSAKTPHRPMTRDANMWSPTLSLLGQRMDGTPGSPASPLIPRGQAINQWSQGQGAQQYEIQVNRSPPR